MIFAVEVDSATHDELRSGDLTTSVVVVEEWTRSAAECLAAQIVSCRGRMPTATRPLALVPQDGDPPGAGRW